MKKVIKQLARRLIGAFVIFTSKTAAGRFLHDQIVNTAVRRTLKVSHGSLELVLPVPNQLCYWRAMTFSAKEPETLQWIDSLPQGALLWDVGANVGLYSVYAAKHRNCRVWSFEPSVFNLELLARNAYLNSVSERVCLVPLALSNALGASRLHMTSTEWGGAFSTFGDDYGWDDKTLGWDGKTLRQVFEFQTLGLSMEDAMQRLGLPQPDYIKMDVDGIEHLILQGGRSVLSRIKGIHIEVDENFREHAELCQRLLTEAGLVLLDKRHSDMIENSQSGFQSTLNQTWIRK